FRDELKARLTAGDDASGPPPGTLVFKPEEIYQTVRNVAPDLIVHFGGLSWRSVGGVGYPALPARENDTGPDDCNHAQHGAFIRAAPGLGARGQVERAHILDIAPTLLELGGYDRPQSMRGQSLSTGSVVAGPTGAGYNAQDEATVRDRLSGLGYLG